jgi:hypothetical protein
VIWDVVEMAIRLSHKLRQKRLSTGGGVFQSQNQRGDETAGRISSPSKSASGKNFNNSAERLAITSIRNESSSSLDEHENSKDISSSDGNLDSNTKNVSQLAERKRQNRKSTSSASRPSSAPSKPKISTQTDVSSSEILTPLSMNEKSFSIPRTSSTNLSKGNLSGVKYPRRTSDGVFGVSKLLGSPAGNNDSAVSTPKSADAGERRERRKPRRTQNQQDEDTVLMGTKISEGHVNYALMYDMLTGIRIAVSRCVAKPHQQLDTSHFRARHKLTFDVMGNELTPSSKYDFKFKDYAPWVFRSIREHFKIEAADYLISLTGKYVLSELGSPGKSGSFFYFSQDYRFIIKTIHETEHKFLRKILPQYYEVFCLFNDF